MGEPPIRFHRRTADGNTPRFTPPVARVPRPEPMPIVDSGAGGTDTWIRVGGVTCQNCVLTVTGESLPVEKSPGAALLAGSANQSGWLVARVTATGESTALARIVGLVRHAQGTRAAVQRLADRVSAVFMPVIIAIAAGAGTWWWLAPSTARSVHSALAEHLWHVHLPESPFAAGVADSTPLAVGGFRAGGAR